MPADFIFNQEKVVVWNYFIIYLYIFDFLPDLRQKFLILGFALGITEQICWNDALCFSEQRL